MRSVPRRNGRRQGRNRHEGKGEMHSVETQKMCAKFLVPRHSDVAGEWKTNIAFVFVFVFLSTGPL
jgi:hypothetical protein